MPHVARSRNRVEPGEEGALSQTVNRWASQMIFGWPPIDRLRLTDSTAAAIEFHNLSRCGPRKRQMGPPRTLRRGVVEGFRTCPGVAEVSK